MSYTTHLENIRDYGKWINTDHQQSLGILKENKRKVHANKRFYYDEENDASVIRYYYRTINSNDSGENLFYMHRSLVKQNHKRIFPYFISKDQFLYTWVDMQPDGSVKSIYSGENNDPQAILEEDKIIIQRRYEDFHLLLTRKKLSLTEWNQSIRAIESQHKFNTEHIVPQSWFGGREPMKGDLHHLFVCHPKCNTMRSNFPYDDFDFYQPESPKEPIRNHCGIAHMGKFEPEFGKGTAARAMLYFLLRYPGTIRNHFYKQVNIPLLLKWSMEFGPTDYEKHRNEAIYQIQGNRNPFIDLPELTENIRFPHKKRGR